MKKIHVFLFVCLLCALLLSGCGTTAAPIDPAADAQTSADVSAAIPDTATEPAAASTVQDEPARAGFTLEDLQRENSLTNLVRAYTNVRVRAYYNGEQTGETHYIWHNGEVASAEMNIYEGEKYYSGFFGSLDFEQIGKRLQATYNVSGQNTFWRDEEVSSMVYSGEISQIRDQGDQWSFRITPTAEGADRNVCTYVVEKETLALDEVTLTLEDGNVVRHTIEHAPTLELDGFGLLDGLNKPYRKVRVCSVLHDDDGKEKFDSVTLDLPYNLEIIPVSDNGALNLYRNESMTRNYSYPGNGKDYTVYATDAMG